MLECIQSMVSGPNWYQIGKKTCSIPVSKILLEKRIFKSTGLKVSSLACKVIFHRPEHNAKGGPHRTEL